VVKMVEFGCLIDLARAVHLAAQNDRPNMKIVTEITPLAVMKAVKNDIEKQVGFFRFDLKDLSSRAEPLFRSFINCI
jgi:hypothetical protein